MIYSEQHIKTLFLSFFILFIQPHSFAQTRSLELRIENIKNAQGVVRISVFRSQEGFPEEFEKADQWISLPAQQDSLFFTFDSLALGEIAFSVLHDENNNKKLDKNFLGLPREGVGVSNNALRTLGPPRYEQCKFVLDMNTDQVDIKIHY
ncbi:DUF2141 domain-containing protein [candidate division KSB1 bacterium]|nr:DUF2141 domain-containing protein [candidate division KSB1 bacterium]